MINRKKYLIAYIILMVVPLLADGISLLLLPDVIPAHYGLGGEVDRFGSKFELFILPACSVIMGILIFLCSKSSSKDETSTKNNEKIVLITGECCLVIFMILNFYMLYLAFNNITNIFDLKLDIGSVCCFLFGIIIIVIGNMLPKSKRNSMVGLRLPWTKSSDEIWKKSQHFGGIVSVICGFLLLISAFIFKGLMAIIVLLSVNILTSIICTVYTYIISHNNIEKT